MSGFNFKNIVSALAALMLAVLCQGQTACPSVSAGPDITMPCGVNCTKLHATVQATGATTSYRVDPITYAPILPFDAGTQVLANLDDHYDTSYVQLPFNFCFFGNTYDSVCIGANGAISFNPGLARSFNSFIVPGPIPNASLPADLKNTIMLPFQDIDPSLQGKIFYQILGTYPCRTFVATWDSIPYYGSLNSSSPGSYCNVNLYSTAQVVIYEITNVIDIFIHRKDTCIGSPNKNAIEGIVNSDGSQAYTVPGRNSTAWAAIDDAWRFTPNGTPAYSSVWYSSANIPPNIVGLGEDVTICQKDQSIASYTVKTTYTPCDGSAPYIVSDDITVSHTGSLLSGIDSSKNLTCNGKSDGAAWAHQIGATAYGWSGPAGFASTQLAISNLSAGTYYFSATDGSCTQNDTVTIIDGQLNTLAASPVITNPTCNQSQDGTIDLKLSGGTPPYTVTPSPSSPDPEKITGLSAGNYNFTITDSNGCTATSSATLSDPLPITISNVRSTAVLCIGDENGTLQVDVSGGTQPYNVSCTVDFTYFHTEIDSTHLMTNLPASDQYSIVIFDSAGCLKIFSPFTVASPERDTFTVTVDSTSCYGPQYNDGSISITAGPNTPYTFSIDSGPGQSSNQFFNVAAGSHMLTFVNLNGCVTKVPALIPQPLPIIADVTPDSITIPLGGSGQVLVTYLNATDVFYEWSPTLGLSCSDCADPIVSPYVSGDYLVSVNMRNRNQVCSGTATLHVTVGEHKEPFFPNVFSPNGDNINDQYLVYGDDIKSVDMKIFDRWGELVFQSHNHFDGWNGMYKGAGEYMMPGVYGYYAVVTFLDDTKMEKRGSITLLR